MQQGHQIASLVLQGVPVQPLIIIHYRVIIEMVIYKGKIKTFNIGIFTKYRKVRIIWHHFIYTVSQRVPHWELRIGLSKMFYEFGITSIGFNKHNSRPAT